MTDWEIRRQIVSFGKKMYEQRLVVAIDGNISVRMKTDKIIITPAATCLGTLDFNHMIHVDAEGKTASGNLHPSSDLPLHLEIYRQRPDVMAVIHAHPPILTAFTISGEDLSTPVLPEMVLMFGEIPVAPYATPSTEESAEAVKDLIKKHDAIILDHHGAVTVGETLKDAYCRLEKIEQSAYILYTAKQLGGIKPLSEAELQELLKLKKKLKYNP